MHIHDRRQLGFVLFVLFRRFALGLNAHQVGGGALGEAAEADLIAVKVAQRAAVVGELAGMDGSRSGGRCAPDGPDASAER